MKFGRKLTELFFDGKRKLSGWVSRGLRDSKEYIEHGETIPDNKYKVEGFLAGANEGWRVKRVDSRKQKVKYTIVTGTSAAILDDNVNEFIMDDWRPSGGVCYADKNGWRPYSRVSYDDGVFVQAMTRKV